MADENNKIDLTTDVKKANRVIFPVMLLLTTFVYFLYDNLNKANLFTDLRRSMDAYGNRLLFYLVYLLVLLFVIVLHAYVHAFFLIVFGGLKKDHIKVVVANKKLMPYVHYDVPVGIAAYRWAIFMPYLLLGLAPLAYGIAERQALWVFAGLLLVVSYMGDVLVLFKLAKISRDYLVLSHPHKYGCICYKDKK